jgi:H+/gluconate symporter-like permease
MAGWPASLIVAVVMFGLGQVYLEWAIRRDLARGERFERWREDVGESPRDGGLRESVVAPQPDSAPGVLRSVTPLLVTLLALNALPLLAKLFPEPAASADWLGAVRRGLLKFRDEPTLAIFAGVLASLGCLRRYLTSCWQPMGDGFVNGLLAIGSTSSVVGFGTALRDLPAFQQLVDWVTHLPVDPLIGAALAVAVIAGIAGSASGGQGLALPIVKPIFVDELGVAPRALHRVVAIASGSLDTMPANGYLVMLIRNICGETHARAYGPIFVTTALIPLFGTALAIVLFKLFPSWQWM